MDKHILTQNEYDEIVGRFNRLPIPADYDRDTMLALSMGNACDVPREKLADTVIDTAMTYIDVREWAEEAGIAPAPESLIREPLS